MRWESVHVNARARETPEGKKSAGRTGGIWGPGKRWGHTCNSVKGGRYLYVFGGYGSDNCQTNDVHVFDSVKQTWSKPMMKGIPPSPRDSHSCTTVGSRLFVFGGTDGTSPLKDLHILDTTSNMWILPTVHGKGPDAREGHSAALVDKRLFIFGGCGKSSDNPEEVYYNDLFILDTETLVWDCAITSGTPPSPRDSHTCSSWKNKIIVLGGEDSSDCYLSDVHMLDADTLVWRKVTTSGQMLAPRAGHTTVSLGSNLFVFGGFTDARNLYDDLHVLNVDTGTWSRVLNANQGPSARFSVAGDCLDERKGILVFIGGCNKTLEALDDMYYLHTDMPVENGQSELRQEKLFLRRELKKKCRDNYLPTKETEGQNNVHMLVAKADLSQPVYLQECSQSAKRYCSTGTQSCDPKSAEEITFEAAVTNVNQFGYAIETIIDGKLLRGMLFSCTSRFVRDDDHVYPNNRRRMGTDTVADRLNNYEPVLKTDTVIHHEKETSDQGQHDGSRVNELTLRESPAGTLSSNLTNLAIDANIHQQNMVSEKLEPMSIPSEYLINEVSHGLHKPSAEKLCETRATDKEVVPATLNQVPVAQAQNSLSNEQTQESEEKHG